MKLSLEKSGDDLLSHKPVYRFVGAGSNRSHAAPTELVPVRVATKTAPQGEGALTVLYNKKRTSF